MNSIFLCAHIPHHTLKLFALEAFWVKLPINVERTLTTSKGLESNKVSKTEIFEASVLLEDTVFVTPKKTDWKDLINSTYKRFNDGHNDCRRISWLEVTGRTNHEHLFLSLFFESGRSRLQLHCAKRFRGWMSNFVLLCALVVKLLNNSSPCFGEYDKTIHQSHISRVSQFFFRLSTNSIY